jgi:hypothetical protein
MKTAVTSWRKSARSGASDTSNCVEVRRAWRKSAHSGSTDTSSCVEVSPCADSEGFHLRDSKLGDGSPVFDLSAGDFRGLLNHAGLEAVASYDSSGRWHVATGPQLSSSRPVFTRRCCTPATFPGSGSRPPGRSRGRVRGRAPL